MVSAQLSDKGIPVLLNVELPDVQVRVIGVTGKAPAVPGKKIGPVYDGNRQITTAGNAGGPSFLN